MSKFLQKSRNIYNQIKFKWASIYRGQNYSAFQTNIALNQKFKPKQKISLKMQSYPQLDKYFIQFLNSAQTQGRINGQNLAFLVGAQNGGKTSYIESNIERFKVMKNDIGNKNIKQQLPLIHRYKSPQYIENETKQTVFQNQYYLILNFNFQKIKSSNFNIFIHQIQQQIIKNIQNLNIKLGQQILDSQTIKQILLSQYSQYYLYIYLKQVIYSIINNIDIIQLSKNNQQKLQIIFTNINQYNIQAQQFFYNPKYFKEIINIIKKDMNLSQVQTTIRLFLSVAKRIQYSNRPSTYINTWYQTGIQSINFLFDILNYICGFGKLNKSIFNDYFFGEHKNNDPNKQQLIKKIKNIKNGPRIDVGIFFLNMDSLYFYDSPQFWNFIDHLISRTTNSNIGLRTHFPLLLEFPNSSDLQDVHNMGQFNLESPVIIELPGYTLHQLFLSNGNVAQLFTKKVLSQLFFKLGRNPHTWEKAFIELAKGAKISSVLQNKSQYILKQSIGLQARINKIFTSIQILPQLCNNTARYQLIQHLRLITKTKGLLNIHYPNYYMDFYTRPIFKLLMKQNIIYQHHYSPYLDLSQLTGLNKLYQIKNQLLSNHYLQFIKWRWNHKHRFNFFKRQGKYRYQVQKQIHNYTTYRKYRLDPQLAETYYGAKQNYFYKYRSQGLQEVVR